MEFVFIILLQVLNFAPFFPSHNQVGPLHLVEVIWSHYQHSSLIGLCISTLHVFRTFSAWRQSEGHTANKKGVRSYFHHLLRVSTMTRYMSLREV